MAVAAARIPETRKQEGSPRDPNMLVSKLAVGRTVYTPPPRDSRETADRNEMVRLLLRPVSDILVTGKALVLFKAIHPSRSKTGCRSKILKILVGSRTTASPGSALDTAQERGKQGSKRLGEQDIITTAQDYCCHPSLQQTGSAHRTTEASTSNPRDSPNTAPTSQASPQLCPAQTHDLSHSSSSGGLYGRSDPSETQEVISARKQGSHGARSQKSTHDIAGQLHQGPQTRQKYSRKDTRGNEDTGDFHGSDRKHGLYKRRAKDGSLGQNLDWQRLSLTQPPKPAHRVVLCGLYGRNGRSDTQGETRVQDQATGAHGPGNNLTISATQAQEAQQRQYNHANRDNDSHHQPNHTTQKTPQQRNRQETQRTAYAGQNGQQNWEGIPAVPGHCFYQWMAREGIETHTEEQPWPTVSHALNLLQKHTTNHYTNSLESTRGLRITRAGNQAWHVDPNGKYYLDEIAGLHPEDRIGGQEDNKGDPTLSQDDDMPIPLRALADCSPRAQGPPPRHPLPRGDAIRLQRQAALKEFIKQHIIRNVEQYQDPSKITIDFQKLADDADGSVLQDAMQTLGFDLSLDDPYQSIGLHRLEGAPPNAINVKAKEQLLRVIWEYWDTYATGFQDRKAYLAKLEGQLLTTLNYIALDSEAACLRRKRFTHGEIQDLDFLSWEPHSEWLGYIITRHESQHPNQTTYALTTDWKAHRAQYVRAIGRRADLRNWWNACQQGPLHVQEWLESITGDTLVTWCPPTKAGLANLFKAWKALGERTNIQHLYLVSAKQIPHDVEDWQNISDHYYVALLDDCWGDVAKETQILHSPTPIGQGDVAKYKIQQMTAFVRRIAHPCASNQDTQHGQRIVSWSQWTASAALTVKLQIVCSRNSAWIIYHAIAHTWEDLLVHIDPPKPSPCNSKDQPRRLIRIAFSDKLTTLDKRRVEQHLKQFPLSARHI